MNKQSILGIVRHILTFAGGYVAAKGIADQAMVNEAIGAIMTIVGIAWSVADKRSA
jgi:hypothetical protein